VLWTQRQGESTSGGWPMHSQTLRVLW
jgi:hypothetical protein